MNEIPYKLKQLRAKFGLTQKQLADRLGVGSTTLSYIEQGTRQINDSVRLALLKEFNYNIDTDEYLNNLKEISIKAANTIRLPFYRVSVAAGSGIYIEDEPIIEDLIFDKRLLKIAMPDVNFEHINCFIASGDSMVTPDNRGIFDGDLLFVDIFKKQVYDGIYVIEANNELRVKRLIKNLDNSLTIKSDNPKYPMEVYNVETSPYKISIVGRVIFNISRGNNLNKFFNF